MPKETIAKAVRSSWFLAPVYFNFGKFDIDTDGFSRQRKGSSLLVYSL
jgi:hypothetical protein